MNTDFPMFDDDPIIFDDEDFPEFGNSYYGDMPEIKKLLIPDGAYLTLNFFEADFIKEGVEEVWIENDFFADVDLSIGLGLMKDLKRFKILNPESPFFVEDGLLYANVDAGRYESRIEALESDEVETECKERQKELCRRYTIFEHLEGYESLCGKVLCSIPPAISKEEIVIPEGVVGICSGAVLNCDLKRLSLPNSLKCVGSLAIQSSQIKELIVSNSVFDTSLNLVDESQIGKVSRRDSTEPLDEKVVEKWLDVFDSDDIQSELSRLIL